MKILYIGCRVRIIGDWTGLIPPGSGTEGFIFYGDCVGGDFKDYDWGVVLDCGFRICANSDELEPIVPDGHIAADRTTMLSMIPELEQFIGVPA